MVSTLFYFASFVFAFCAFLFYKKSEDIQNMIAWLPVTFLVVVCLNAFCAGILSLLTIPIGLTVASFINLVIGGSFFAMIILRHERQYYEAKIVDIVAFCSIFFVALMCGVMQFGTGFELHYGTSDPAIHLWISMEIVNTGNLEGLYLFHYFLSMLIQAASPFLAVTESYKVMICADVFLLFLSGAMLYAVVHDIASSKFGKLCTVVLVMLYVLAYPFNNMLFGFGYLGLSVTMTALIIFILKVLLAGNIKYQVGIFIVMLSLFGVSISYSLFIPTVYGSVLIVLLYWVRKTDKIWSWRTGVVVFSIFAPPAILAFLYSYLGMFGEGLSISGQLNTEGFIYRDLYSNFIIIAPFIIYAVIHAIKMRKAEVSLVFFAVNLIIMIIVFCLGMFGYASSYYYFKFYYLMWLFAVVVAVIGINLLLKKSFYAVLSYCLVWMMVMAFAVSGIDQKINERNVLLNPQVKSWSYLDIYHYNLEQGRAEPAYGSAYLELFRQAYDFQSNGKIVPLLGDWITVYWYQAITNQDLSNYYQWVYDADTFVGKIEESEYAVVLSNSEEAAPIMRMLTDYMVVFQNDAGQIIRIS